MTTWSLHKLIRSYLKLGWTHEQIVDLFYRNGYIEPVPSHYEYVGTVDHFFDKIRVVRVQVENSELAVGNRIAFELPVEFEEQSVDSLHVDEEPVQVAKIGTQATILTPFNKAQLKKGTRVFRIKNDHS